MVGESSPLKIKPKTESGREATLLPGNGTGRSGHRRNTSRSMIEGELSSANSQPGSPVTRKDQSQITNKNQAHVPTRSSSIRHETTRNRDLNNTKKPAEHHYMKTTHCFNAKSKRPIDLDSPKLKKKPDPDPYGVRRKSDSVLGLQRQKPAEPINPYLKARSRPSSVDSQTQSTPMLKRSPSLNSSRIPRQNRQGIPKPAGSKKYSTRQETEVGSFTSDHLSDAENGESVLKEIPKDNSSYLYSNKQEGTLQIVETEIKPDMISQTSINDMELLVETADFDLSFNPGITSVYGSWEKDILSKNLPDPEINTKETTMEGSVKHPDSNLEVISSEKVDVVSNNLPESEIETKEINMEGSPEHPENNLKVISSAKPEVISQNLPEPEIVTKETIMEGSPKHPASNLKLTNSENLHAIGKNLSEVEIETRKMIMENSPKGPDNNLEVTAENKNLETYEVTEENISAIGNDVMESLPPDKITRDTNENCEKQEVIHTRYDEIDDLCVLSSSNDEDDLCEISIEVELPKIISTEKMHCTTQEQKVLPIDIVPIIEEIANELEGMDKDPVGGSSDDMHPTWMLKKWKVDYVLQRLIEKLESTDKNNVSKLIQAYETVIALMICHVAVPHQTTGQ